jgi:hypothetical protein
MTGRRNIVFSILFSTILLSSTSPTDDNHSSRARPKQQEFKSEFARLPTRTTHREAHPFEVTISSGSIRGEYMKIGANEYTVFKGIPYARPPVGKYRFRVR